jgi:hypothetical protein
MSGDHSGAVPPLPIPNRTVKRPSANDSRLSARESRSSPDSPLLKRPASRGVCLCILEIERYSLVIKPKAISVARNTPICLEHSSRALNDPCYLGIELTRSQRDF